MYKTQGFDNEESVQVLQEPAQELLCDSVTNLPGILRVLGCGCQRQLMELRSGENYHMALW